MKLELTIIDRIRLSEVLPSQGGRIKMILAKSIADLIGFTAPEIQAFELRDLPDGKVKWNPGKDQPVAFEFSPEQISVLKEGIAEADRREVVTLDMLPVIEKIELL